MPGPIWLYVGRVAVEKNIEAFLALDLPGTKVVVGDGPARARAASSKYPGREIPRRPRPARSWSRAYAGSDVFVFPSRTDTFGLVLLEALACGLPVAAYPVQGPLDVVGRCAPVAALDEDLAQACLRALDIARRQSRPRAFAADHSWRACTLQFLRQSARSSRTRPERDQQPLPAGAQPCARSARLPARSSRPVSMPCHRVRAPPDSRRRNGCSSACIVLFWAALRGRAGQGHVAGISAIITGTRPMPS